MKFLPHLVLSVMIVWMMPGNSAPLHLETSRISLSSENAATKSVGKLDCRGGLELRSDHEKLGGLSGMAIPKDGKVLRMVTDNGYWIRAELALDPMGHLVGLKAPQIGPLIGKNGKLISFLIIKTQSPYFETMMDMSHRLKGITVY